MDQLNVCLTGLPRSGTTLTCALLNQLPDAVALHEPMKANTFTKLGNRNAVCEAIADFFENTRSAIEAGNTIVAKKAGGKRREKTVKRKLTVPFTLCIKHPAAFTAILESLVHRFSCFAVIRNPLSTLGSWNRMTMPVNDGHSPAAEKLDAELAAHLARIEDKFDRQLFLLSWYFAQYRRFLPKPSIVRYEDIVASGGKCLNVITASAADLSRPLKSRNEQSRYGIEIMQRLGEKLLKTDGEYWEFYSRESVEAVLKN